MTLFQRPKRSHSNRFGARLLVGLLAAALVVGVQAVALPAAPASAATPDRQALAQTLMNARAAGSFSSIYTGVVERMIAPVAAGIQPAAGCVVDTRILQLLVQTVQTYGSVTISDLNRNCPGAPQDPPCPSTYVSPHCSGTGRAVDFVWIGGTNTVGNSLSLPYLRFFDQLVPTGTVAGQVGCGSVASFVNITNRIPDECDHIHIALPENGAIGGPAPKKSVNVSDFSGDGSSDVLGVSAAGELLYYPNNAQALSPGIAIGSGWGGFTHVMSADFSGDGSADVLGVSAAGELLYYANNGQTLSPGVAIGSGWGGFTQVMAADYNGDGAADVLGVSAAGELLFYANNGLTLAPGVAIGSGWGGFSQVMAADFSGDGSADVLGVSSAGELLYYANNGLALSAGVAIGSGWSSFSHVLASDFSGDGAADVLGVSAAGELLYYANNGFALSPGVAIGSGWGSFSHVM